ncbi:MAG: four helix bundle protein [Candidatus Kuenenia sp.]|nr:four helix bundle protein [Candidatus Kuenenia hertensis]
MYKSFREMPIWGEAMEIAESVFRLTESLPKKEDYGLTSQIRRAALSISANIAEAFGRYHINDKINFYYFSRGSVAETQNHLEYGLRVGYFRQAGVSTIDSKLNKLYESINRLIKSLKSQSQSQSQPKPKPGYTKP